MFYDNDNLNIDKIWIPLYIASGSSQDNQFVLSFYNGVGELSYTAGLRPVIKVKLDKIERVDGDNKIVIINNTKGNDKNIIKEQEKNSNYGALDNNDDVNKKYNKLNDNISISSYYNIEDEIDSNIKLVKYILFGLILLVILNITQVFLSTIFFKKMRRKKKLK